MTSYKQIIVDEIEAEGFFLVDSLKDELFFTTTTGQVDTRHLDLVYDIASEYASVDVFDAYFEGEPCVVVKIFGY